MTHTQLLKNHRAHSNFIAFAGGYDDLAATIAASNSIVFLRWSLRLIADPRKRVGVAAHIVRHTPIGDDGRTVYDLLTNARSRHALDVCDRYAIGVATESELATARVGAAAAAKTTRAASFATYYAATAVHYATAAARAAAESAASFAASYARKRAATNKWQSDYIHSLDWATITEALA